MKKGTWAFFLHRKTTSLPYPRVAAGGVGEVEELGVHVSGAHHAQRAAEQDGVQHRPQHLLHLERLGPQRAQGEYLTIHFDGATRELFCERLTDGDDSHGGTCLAGAGRGALDAATTAAGDGAGAGGVG